MFKASLENLLPSGDTLSILLDEPIFQHHKYSISAMELVLVLLIVILSRGGKLLIWRRASWWGHPSAIVVNNCNLEIVVPLSLYEAAHVFAIL